LHGGQIIMAQKTLSMRRSKPKEVGVRPTVEAVQHNCTRHWRNR
jgi:hypothetical protein